MCCKNTFLFLLLSALLGTGGAFAQQSITSYEDLKDAIEKVNSLPELETQINRLQTIVDQNEANPVSQYIYGVKTEQKTPESAKKIKDFVDCFLNGTSQQPAISIAYRVIAQTNLGKTSYTVQVTTSDIANDIANNEDGKWTTISTNIVTNTDEQLKHRLTKPNTTNEYIKKGSLVVLYKDGTNISETDGQQITSDDEDYIIIFWVEILRAIKSEAGKVPLVSVTETTSVENPDYGPWKEKADKAAEDLTTAKNKKTAAEKFKNLTIGGIITVNKVDVAEEADSYLGDWPDGCKINGKGYRIINEYGKPLFDKNNGDISNWISLNQNIANSSSSSAHVRNTIARTADGTGYNVYNGEGNLTSTTNLEDAVYTLRTVYGMDLTKGESSIGAVTDEKSNKLYQIKYANAKNYEIDAETQKKSVIEYTLKANIKDSKLVFDKKKVASIVMNEDGELSTDNAVIYMDDDDVPTSVAKNPNVAVKTGNKYVCAEAKLTDESTSSEFYVPYNFTATNLTYNRNVKTDLVTVCLPFTLTKEVLKDIGTIAELDVKAYSFKEVGDNNVMWFNQLDAVNANVPCILSFKKTSVNEEGQTETKSTAPNKTVFTGLKDVSFTSTKGAALSSNSTNTNGKKQFFGNYKAKQTADFLAQQSSERGGEGSAIYTLLEGKLKKMPKSNNAYMNAFRSFVAMKEDLTQSNAPVFRVGLLDKDGNEDIVTGIKAVNTSNTSSDFKAVGSRNAIEITTGKACDVKVYTLNGALAKTARVEAGTTTLPMNAGMYVVNKTKVIVK